MKNILSYKSKIGRWLSMATFSGTFLFHMVYASGVADQAVENMNSGSDVYGVIAEVTQILAALGFLIAIGKLMQIGIMFLVGSGGKTANAKASLLPWAVGALICATYATLGPSLINMIGGSGGGSVFDI